MKAAVDVARLALRFNLAAKLKFTLLAILVAVGLLVFLVVAELSRVSTESLDDAISQELGRAGLHSISVPTLGLGPQEMAVQVERAFRGVALEPPIVTEVLPPISADCPPFESLGQHAIIIPRLVTGEPVPVPFGAGLPPGSQLCFDGHVIPPQAIYAPATGESNDWGSGIVVDPDYARLVKLSTTGEIRYTVAVFTGERDGTRVADLLERELADVAARQGVAPLELLSRAPQSGEGVRSASEGIALVYRVIGWGVLVLAALGLLVAELIVVRDRTWFFGLSRAVGARGHHIAGLVFADVLLVLTAGTALAVAGATLVQPVVGDFARATFDVQVKLVQGATIQTLAAGSLLVLLLAGAFPAYRATRQDPLDVLEGR